MKGSVALVASSSNPKDIEKSIVVAASSENFKKVVGIIYRAGWEVPASSDNEVAEFTAHGKVQSVLKESEGLVRVVGQSAEPVALDGQYLILGKPVFGRNDLEQYNDKPVVVEHNGSAVFKRLRLTKDAMVLESLDINGRFPPIVYAVSELDESKASVRPVLGVLFHAPG